jgi:hypothetical protein
MEAAHTYSYVHTALKHPYFCLVLASKQKRRLIKNERLFQIEGFEKRRSSFSFSSSNPVMEECVMICNLLEPSNSSKHLFVQTKKGADVLVEGFEERQ